MKEKRQNIIYQYEDGDDQEKIGFLKNSYDINKKKYLFHAEFYDIFNVNEEETFSITRVGANKRIKNFK